MCPYLCEYRMGVCDYITQSTVQKLSAQDCASTVAASYMYNYSLSRDQTRANGHSPLFAPTLSAGVKSIAILCTSSS